MATEYLSPLIDREIFFGNPKIAGAQLSPDGKFMSFLMAYQDVLNIWIKPLDLPFEKAYPLTKDFDRPIRSYFWSWDSKYVIYAQDRGGDENFGLFAVDPSSANENYVPEARDLTPYENTHAYVVSLPKSDPEIILVAMNDRDKTWHDFYSINIANGNINLIHKNEEKLSSLYFDLDSRPKLASRSTEDGGNEILQLTDKGFERIFYANLEESIHPVKFRKDGKVYFISNIGEVDLSGLYLYDPKTRDLTFVESDPEKQVDLENLTFSIQSEELIATIYIGDKKRIYWRDNVFQTDYNILKDKFPNAEISISSSSYDENLWIIYIASDKDPGSAYLFDRHLKSIDYLYSPRSDLPKEHLAEMTPVRYQSIDGLEIPAYLTIPVSKINDLLPAVIFVHGGPWARDYWGYNSFAQFLANRDYAVLQVNFRGSTGYGKAFLNAAINEWGEKMQDDLTAGYHYLVDQKIADPKRVAIMGGSYGGYATLAGLCFTPDIYAAGVSIVGPSNLFTLLDTIPPYWESARVMFHKRMGDPTTEEGRKQLKRQSPFFHANKIKAPLLVAQGANDPRVKKSESDQIVIAVRDQNKAVEYLNFPDEGHGFAKPENNMAFITVMEKFLAHQLKGRYQEESSDNIQEIISRATVDVKALKMPQIVSKENLNKAHILPTREIIACNILYEIEITIQGQKMNFEIQRNVTIEASRIIVKDQSESPMGNMLDISIFDSVAFTPIKREINQAPLKVLLDFKENTVTGEIQIPNNTIEVNQKFESDIILDGPMLDLYLEHLELIEGDSSYLRVFNSQNQKLDYFKLTKRDVVNINAYSCALIEIYSADGSELIERNWISNQAPFKLIKKIKIIKEMNGAEMIMELNEKK